MSQERPIFAEKEPLQDHCGLVVEYAQTDTSAFIGCLAGLKKIQTRGYDGAGVFAMNSQGESISHIGEGMITDVFTKDVVEKFKSYPATLWMLQTRYGTNGDWRKENLQPIVRQTNTGEVFAVVHNGQFQKTLDNGVSDTVLFADTLALPSNLSWEDRLIELQQFGLGAWSIAIGTTKALYLMRDPNGIRPLVCGVRVNPHTKQPSYVAASETAALKVMGAKDFWEVPPNTIIKIDHQGPQIIYQGENNPAPCIFENVYLQNGKTVIHRFENDRDLATEPTVEHFRHKCGELLALSESIEIASQIDFVVGIPGTGVAGGRSYAETLGLPYIQAITDRKPMENDARTFMTQDINEIPNKILGHFYFDENFFPNMKVVLVDDSIVRGNITQGIIKLLKDQYGVKEVHIRVLCPPIDKPCHLGINTRKRSELIAALDEKSLPEVVEHVRNQIGADSLAYISSEDLIKAAGGGRFCLGCMFGHHPPI